MKETLYLETLYFLCNLKVFFFFFLVAWKFKETVKIIIKRNNLFCMFYLIKFSVEEVTFPLSLFCSQKSFIIKMLSVQKCADSKYPP